MDVRPDVFAAYPTSRTRFAHAVDIRTRYGYTSFGEGLPSGLFLQWLDDRVWTGAERPTVLVDLATAWLVEHKVLLPGITTLTRLIAERARPNARRSWRIVGAQMDDADRVRLEWRDWGGRLSPIDALGAATPYRRSIRQTRQRVLGLGQRW